MRRSEDLDYEMVGGSRDREHIIRVAARLTLDVGDEIKAVVDDVASGRKVSYQMDDIGGYSFKPPDGPTQLDIEMLPLGGVAVEPVVYVSGILLISHEFNAQRLHEFQHSVLDNTASLLAAKMIEAEIRAGEKAETLMKNADARGDRNGEAAGAPQPEEG